MTGALAVVVGVVVGALAAAGNLTLTYVRTELVAKGRLGLATGLHWCGLALLAAVLITPRPLGQSSLWAGAASLLVFRSLALFALRRRLHLAPEEERR